MVSHIGPPVFPEADLPRFFMLLRNLFKQRAVGNYINTK
jgi:hypothetical protein